MVIDPMEWRPSRDVILNGVLFIAIIPVLIGLHFLLPNPVRESLVFDHSEFALYTLWTSAYVHASNGHLFNNVFGYVMAMPLRAIIYNSFPCHFSRYSAGTQGL